MTHRRAARLVTSLLDGGLSPATRRAVRAHVRACPSCRRRVREHEAVEALVRLLPPSLVPCEPSRAAQVRLWGLARWFVDPVARARERLGFSAVGVGAVALATALGIAIAVWFPTQYDRFAVRVLAQAGPDVASLLPVGWR